MTFLVHDKMMYVIVQYNVHPYAKLDKGATNIANQWKVRSDTFCSRDYTGTVDGGGGVVFLSLSQRRTF